MSITRDNAFAQVPEWVLFSDVSANAIRLYAVLWTKADYGSHSTGDYSPSIRTLADGCRVSPNTVRRALVELVDLGALVVTRRRVDDGDNLPNDYQLISSDPRTCSNIAPPTATSGTPPTATSGTPPTATSGTLSRPFSNETLSNESSAPVKAGADASVAADLLSEWKNLYPQTPPRKVQAQMAGQITALVEDEIPAGTIRSALTAYASKKNVGPGILPSLVMDLQRVDTPTRWLGVDDVTVRYVTESYL